MFFAFLRSKGFVSMSYSKKGSHMWKLLFTERVYTPLPSSWHLYHLLLALVGPGCAWLLLSKTRDRMLQMDAANQLREAEKMKGPLEEETEKKKDLAVLKEEVATLKTQMELIRAQSAKKEEKD